MAKPGPKTVYAPHNYLLCSRTREYLSLVWSLRKALGKPMTYDQILAGMARHSAKRLETRARKAGIDVDKLKSESGPVQKRASRLDTLNDGPVIDEYKA